MYPVYFRDSPQTLFGLVFLPDSPGVPAKWVLHLPAFAEEMNKCRAMVNRQARAFAARGIAVVVPDLTGTGDSGGEFSEASWEIWKSDVAFLVDWMRAQGATEICLWGLRLGALLAVNVATEHPDSFQELLLWQPVYAGKQAMTQFLRLRMAAGMMQGNQESVDELRARGGEGEVIEVAGYPLDAGLLLDIDRLEIAQMPLPGICKIALFEVAGAPDKPLTVPSRNQVKAWTSAGVEVACGVVSGEPFWSTQEIAGAPALIDASLSAIVAAGSVERSMTRNLGISAANGSVEKAVVFKCRDEQLLGILHRGAPDAARGVLVIVGGPQYRVGSHRQFLQIARALAREGTPVFRFDYRGMGDSSGSPVDFLAIADDIRAALDAFQANCTQLREYTLWGLCDAATAASWYAPSDPRVTGLVLLNPWVRSESGEAKAYIRYYYLQRFTSRVFWWKLICGKFDIKASTASLIKKIQSSFRRSSTGNREGDAAGLPLFERLEIALEKFWGRVLIILSGNDLTAAEFSDASKASIRFRKLLDRGHVVVKTCPEADHTFSRKAWKDQVTRWTEGWVSEKT